MIAAIEENFQQREIAEASFRYQAEVESKQRVVVGVNRYQLEQEAEIELLRVDPALEQKQIDRVQARPRAPRLGGRRALARRAEGGVAAGGRQPDAAADRGLARVRDHG